METCSLKELDGSTNMFCIVVVDDIMSL